MLFSLTSPSLQISEISIINLTQIQYRHNWTIVTFEGYFVAIKMSQLLHF